jgi:hypothetical protein
MSLPFDPNDLNAKNAIKALPGLTDEELDAVYEAELDGKARATVLHAITDSREGLVREEEAEEEAEEIREEAAEAPAAAPAAAPKEKPRHHCSVYV